MRLAITVCLIQLLGFALPAQHVNVINLKKGLTNNYVQCMLQDNQGNIWIGTRDGLNVYNGHQIESYRLELSSSFIYSLMQHSSGDLWIGNSQGGINIYDPTKETFKSLNKQPGFELLAQTDVYDLYEDQEHNIWVGTLQGLGKIPHNKDTLLWHEQVDNESVLEFTSIFQSNDKTVWIGTSNGLWFVDQTKKQLSVIPIEVPELQNTFIRDIVGDEIGMLWIATDREGVLSLDPKTQRVSKYTVGPKNSSVWKILVDSRGNLWAAVINGGIFKLDKNVGTFQTYQNHISSYFNSESITGILEDFNGNLWVASHGDGVCYFNPEKYVFEKHLSGEVSGENQRPVTVSSFLEDHNGNLWIGTDGEGVKKFNPPNKFVDAYSTANGLSSNIILDMIEDAQHGKWFATWQGGVDYIEPTGEHVNVFNQNSKSNFGLKSPDVKSLLIDSKENLWMATHGEGVTIYDLKNQQFISPTEITHGYHPDFGQWGSDLLQASNGDIWVASHAGLVRYTDDTVQNYYARNTPGMLASSLIYCLFEDSKGGIWVGTSNSLEKFLPEKKVFENYSVLYNVPVNVKCILEDEHNQLWISSVHEIISLDPESKKIQRFDGSYNTQEGQFHECACLKTKAGKMYFGGTEGFNSFWPDSLKESNISSKLLITDLYLFNKKQKPEDTEGVLQEAMPFCRELNLAYDHNIIGLEFLSMDYLPQGKTKYSYMMEGFNEDWTPPSKSRIANYTNLNPGEYLFRVRSLSLQGYILGETSLIINIIPPFWMTIWFRILAVIIGIGVIVGFLLFRLYWSRQQRLQLQMLVKERTKEVSEKHVLLEDQAHFLQSKNKELEKQEVKIREQASILVDQRDDLHRNNKVLQDLVTIKNKLFSIIAHDLRNPFTSLLGFTKLLHTQYDRYTEDQRKKLIRRLHDSSSSIYSLLDNLLIWSKSQQDQLVFEPEKVFFKILVAYHFELIHDDAAKKMISLKANAPEEVSFIADRNMLSTILRNLLSNAIKYSPINGKIEVGYQLVDNSIEIYVKDEGQGLEDPSKLFLIEESLQKQRDHNHGLGLILCKEFVEKHGGIITVKENIDKGARFSFTLPASNTSIEPVDSTGTFPKSQSIVENNSDGSNTESLTTILIVEDDDDIRWYIKQTLFPEFQVLEAVNGNNGAAKVLAHMPDLIISDMNMPGINGLELCEKVKSNPQTSHIPFVMLTAERSNDKKIEGFGNGADDYLTKPIDAAVLRARIFNILETRSMLKSIYQRDITSDPAAFTTNTLDQEFIQKLNDIIESRLVDEKLSPDTLASDMNISRTGLYTKVKAITGESVSIYIRNVRLKESCVLLKAKKMNISEVAFAVGFNQLPYFTSCFKSTFGMTPTEYIRD
ncbi:MAG: response regulator [Reichenbachiella sp.]